MASWIIQMGGHSVMTKVPIKRAAEDQSHRGVMKAEIRVLALRWSRETEANECRRPLET